MFLADTADAAAQTVNVLAQQGQFVLGVVIGLVVMLAVNWINKTDVGALLKIQNERIKELEKLANEKDKRIDTLHKKLEKT